MIANVQPLPQVVPLKIEPLQLDASANANGPGDDGPLAAAPSAATESLGFTALLRTLDAGSAALEKAQSAENAFAAGTGGLQEMVFERAKADSIVSIAAAASSRVTQSLNTITQMQL